MQKTFLRKMCMTYGRKEESMKVHFLEKRQNDGEFSWKNGKMSEICPGKVAKLII